MKSSPYRKRYILIHGESLSSDIREVEKTLHRVFRAKRKYMSGDYAVFLTNQYYRDQLISFINGEMEGLETIVTSGSMRKCKKVLASILDAQLAGANA